MTVLLFPDGRQVVPLGCFTEISTAKALPYGAAINDLVLGCAYRRGQCLVLPVESSFESAPLHK